MAQNYGRSRRDNLAGCHLLCHCDCSIALDRADPEHLSAAQQVLDRPLAQAKRDAGEEMSLDALSDLVAGYEDEHDPIAPVSDADMLRHLMQVKHVNQAGLSKETGIARSTVSEVFAGKKPFIRKIIRNLADFFDVDVFWFPSSGLGTRTTKRLQSPHSAVTMPVHA